jgi:hypothetical protein
VWHNNTYTVENLNPEVADPTSTGIELRVHSISSYASFVDVFITSQLVAIGNFIDM